MKSKRFQMLQPPDWLAEFKRQANKQGKSLSAWMGDTCRDSLPARIANKLSKRNPAHRPKGKS